MNSLCKNYGISFTQHVYEAIKACTRVKQGLEPRRYHRRQMLEAVEAAREAKAAYIHEQYEFEALVGEGVHQTKKLYRSLAENKYQRFESDEQRANYCINQVSDRLHLASSCITNALVLEAFNAK